MKTHLGIASDAWWNDDLAGLSDDVGLEECLRQAAVAWFAGMETGRRFPMDMAELGQILAKCGISVCCGWIPGLLLDDAIAVKKDRIAQQACFKAAIAPFQAPDRKREALRDAAMKGAFTVSGGGSLDFEAIVKTLAGKGRWGWRVVEAEQDPKVSPPLDMAKKGRKELLRVVAAAGCEAVQ
jgi:sugar phosphate isomerase/epimerase